MFLPLLEFCRNATIVAMKAFLLAAVLAIGAYFLFSGRLPYRIEIVPTESESISATETPVNHDAPTDQTALVAEQEPVDASESTHSNGIIASPEIKILDDYLVSVTTHGKTTISEPGQISEVIFMSAGLNRAAIVKSRRQWMAEDTKRKVADILSEERKLMKSLGFEVVNEFSEVPKSVQGPLVIVLATVDKKDIQQPNGELIGRISSDTITLAEQIDPLKWIGLIKLKNGQAGYAFVTQKYVLFLTDNTSPKLKRLGRFYLSIMPFDEDMKTVDGIVK